jgi:hypothetical protein
MCAQADLCNTVTVGIKQEHRRVNMGETGSMSEKLMLQPTHNPG